MNQYINQQADICFYESDFNIYILFERDATTLTPKGLSDISAMT